MRGDFLYKVGGCWLPPQESFRGLCHYPDAKRCTVRHVFSICLECNFEKEVNFTKICVYVFEKGRLER
jgi:hypothetical protein